MGQNCSQCLNKRTQTTELDHVKKGSRSATMRENCNKKSINNKCIVIETKMRDDGIQSGSITNSSKERIVMDSIIKDEESRNTKDPFSNLFNKSGAANNQKSTAEFATKLPSISERFETEGNTY